SPQEFRRWLTTLDGRGPQVGYERQPTIVAGLFKLRAPWPSGAALRLAVYPQEPFRIHVFGGHAAVTLEYTTQPRPSWAAYASVASPQRPRPERAASVGCD